MPRALYARQSSTASFFQEHQQQLEEAADTTELGGNGAENVTEQSAKQPQRRSVDVHTSMRYLQSKGISWLQHSRVLHKTSMLLSSLPISACPVPVPAPFPQAEFWFRPTFANP